MSFAISSLVRLIVVATLGASLLAIGLSRLHPLKAEWRTRVTTRYFHINEYYLHVADRVPRWLDAETGRVEAPVLEDGDILEAASCAPWVDERGKYQIAGRWATRTKMGPMSVSTNFGLARYSFPDGRMLDHVSTETVPVGAPCWFPGSRARILFAGGDGELYHYAFEPDLNLAGGSTRPTRDASPVRIVWRCPKPGLGEVFLSDLSWPEDPRMSGHLVVALREQKPAPDGCRCFTKTGLWWLKLDFDGTAIVEAGRLLLSDGSKEAESSADQRAPAVGTLRGGGLALAYLSQTAPERGWELRLAPIEFEGDHRVPRALNSKSQVRATRCQPSQPAFSADGRWLNAISDADQEGVKIVRIPLDGPTFRAD